MAASTDSNQAWRPVDEKMSSLAIAAFLASAASICPPGGSHFVPVLLASFCTCPLPGLHQASHRLIRS